MFSEETEIYGVVLPFHCNHLVPCREEGGGFGRGKGEV